MAEVNQKISPVFPPEHELNNMKITENFCYTNLKVMKCNFTWTINNFSCWVGDMGEYLTSPQFSSDDNDEIKWFLRAYPKGFQEKVHLALSLHLESSNKSELKTKVKLSIKKKRSGFLVREFEHSFKKGSYFGVEPFLERYQLLNENYGYLPKDKLTIFCEVCVFCDTVNMSCKNFNIPESELALSFDDTQYSDVTLSVGDQKFNAHKVILAARSPVFAVMFAHEMKERDKNHVDIVDVDPEVFEEMLRFMYNGKAPNLEKFTKKLLSAANKYLLENLKMMCEKELCTKLTVETAAELLIFSDLHCATQLKDRTKTFIFNHLIEVVPTSGWCNMNVTHPFLVAETFQAK